MTPPVETLRSSRAEPAVLRQARAEEIKEAWRASRAPDATAALSLHPDLAMSRSIAIDLAFEEYCLRKESGEELDVEAFCSRFSFSSALGNLIGICNLLGDNPNVLEDIPTEWPALGDALGDFIVVRQLGRGAFSRVYLGMEMTAGERPVVLKISSPLNREAQTLGPLSHPHLVAVLSSRRVRNWNVVAMPFVGTATLADLFAAAWTSGSTYPRSGQTILDAARIGSDADDPHFSSQTAFPIEPGMRYEDAIATIAANLFSGMAYLHAAELAHRDIKPSNVLLGPGGHPYLLDFNLAAEATDRLSLAGTIPYMAPEQLVLITNKKAPPPTDWRKADIFACGIVLFELLTGRHPFGKQKYDPKVKLEVVANEMLNLQFGGHPSMKSLNSCIRRTLRTAIERCLSLDSRQRPTAADLAALLAPEPSRRSRWRRIAAILFPAIVLTLILAIAWFRQPKPENNPVQPEPATVTPSLALPVDPFERGLMFHRQKQHASAAYEFASAGEKQHSGKAYAFAAYCYELRKDHSAANLSAEEAIRLDYRDLAVYANRAYSRLRIGKGRLLESKEDCDLVIKRDPKLSAVRFTRMEIHLQFALRNRPLSQDVIEDIDWLFSQKSNPPEIWVRVAQICPFVDGDKGVMRGKALRAVSEAILAGKPPASLSTDPLLEYLRDDPGYREALKLTPMKSIKYDDIYLVNPIPNP